MNRRILSMLYFYIPEAGRWNQSTPPLREETMEIWHLMQREMLKSTPPLREETQLSIDKTIKDMA